MFQVMLRRLSFGVLALASLILAAGCGGSGNPLNRQAVSGTVNLDGQPLANGGIRFEPVGNFPGATVGFGQIEEGEYSIPEAQGLPPGKYRVSITSPETPAGSTSTEKPADPVAEMAAKSQPTKERIPARYNAKSTLDATVTDGGPNTFPFELTSAARGG